jgi:hypothetical protein
VDGRVRNHFTFRGESLGEFSGLATPLEAMLTFFQAAAIGSDLTIR